MLNTSLDIYFSKDFKEHRASPYYFGLPSNVTSFDVDFDAIGRDGLLHRLRVPFTADLNIHELTLSCPRLKSLGFTFIKNLYSMDLKWPNDVALGLQTELQLDSPSALSFWLPAVATGIFNVKYLETKSG